MNNVPISCCTHNNRKSILKEVIENVVLFLMNLLWILNDDSGCLVQGHFQPEIWWIINIKGNKTNISMSNKLIWVSMEQEKGSVQCEIWQVCMGVHKHTHIRADNRTQYFVTRCVQNPLPLTLSTTWKQIYNTYSYNTLTEVLYRWNQFLSPYSISTK
jgi:hypothetical protein